ncbi:MAG: hypothetical protein FWB74_04345 [Defluviitaleaceae bacterium]|nr:hypothetical protein [Defluviitaleaceae bacterium]
MAYGIKVALIAVGEILRKADSIEEAFEAVQTMANAEGVLLRPLEPKNVEGDEADANNA